MLRLMCKLFCASVAMAMMGVGLLIVALGASGTAEGVEVTRFAPRPEPRELSLVPAELPVNRCLYAGMSLKGWAGQQNVELEVTDDRVQGWIGIDAVNWAHDGRNVRGELRGAPVSLTAGPGMLQGSVGADSFQLEIPRPTGVEAIASSSTAAIAAAALGRKLPGIAESCAYAVLAAMPRECAIAYTLSAPQFSGELRTLRRYRDQVLERSLLGKSLIRLYYRASPELKNVLSRHDGLKSTFRAMLEPIGELASARL